MRKRRINPDYLVRITGMDVKNEPIDSLDLALSIKRFANEYLAGIVNVSIEGKSEGKVGLKLSVVSYLIRLISMSTEDGTVDLTVSLGENLKIDARFDYMPSVDDTVDIINAAKLSGFEVSREDNTLSFTAKVIGSRIMQVYAASSDEFYDLLVLTYKM